MKSQTKLVLTILHITSWAIYFGLLIKTGAIAYTCFVSLFLSPESAQSLYMGLDLSGLYEFSRVHYAALSGLIILLTGLKAYIFHLLIEIFKKINFVNPFSIGVSKLIFGISYVAFGIVLLTGGGTAYCDWLAQRGVAIPEMKDYLGGGDEFLLLAGIIFIIAQVFRRGIELQAENELTV